MRKTQFIKEKSILSSLCDTGDKLADEIGATAILVFTDTGKTALMLSKYRASVPIVAISDNEKTCSTMALYRGTWPILSSRPFSAMKSIKDMLEEAEQQALAHELVKKGDVVVMMAGVPIGSAKGTNMIRVHRIGDAF